MEAIRGRDNAKMAFLPSLNHGPAGSSPPQQPTSIHMGWLLTAQGDDGIRGSGSRPVTHGNDGGSQRFTPKESSSSYPCVTCSRPPPGFCPLLTSGTPLSPFLPSISVHLSLSPLSGPSSSNFVNLPPPSSTAMHSEANLS